MDLITSSLVDAIGVHLRRRQDRLWQAKLAFLALGIGVIHNFESHTASALGCPLRLIAQITQHLFTLSLPINPDTLLPKISRTLPHNNHPQFPPIQKLLLIPLNLLNILMEKPHRLVVRNLILPLSLQGIHQL